MGPGKTGGAWESIGHFMRSTSGSPDPLSVTSVARSLGISRRLLELVYREDRGMTPREEIQRVRFATAIGMLRQTDLPITEVAFRVSLSEPATLSRMVSRPSGRTPRSYRWLRRGTPGNA